MRRNNRGVTKERESAQRNSRGAQRSVKPQECAQKNVGEHEASMEDQIRGDRMKIKSNNHPFGKRQWWLGVKEKNLVSYPSRILLFIL